MMKEVRSETDLPPEFIGFWRALCECNQRNSKAAHRELVARYLRGEHIPGYPRIFSVDPPKKLPRGWSLRNLMRFRMTQIHNS